MCGKFKMKAQDPFGFAGAINLPNNKKTIDKVHKLLFKKKLTISPTFVPRGSGNNSMGGKRDLHYKIKEWGFVFPTKADAVKYANEHIEGSGGQIIKRRKKK